MEKQRVRSKKVQKMLNFKQTHELTHNSANVFQPNQIQANESIFFLFLYLSVVFFNVSTVQFLSTGCSMHYIINTKLISVYWWCHFTSLNEVQKSCLLLSLYPPILIIFLNIFSTYIQNHIRKYVIFALTCQT